MAESAGGVSGAGGARGPDRRRTLWRPTKPLGPEEPGTEVFPSRRWRLSDLRARAQALLGLGVMRVSGPLRKADPGEAVLARARVKRAQIRELYFYKQEISENAARYQEKSPKGRIKLVLPYDGDKYFSRQARRDIDHAGRSGAEALIGHLVLTGFEHANLNGLLDEGPTHGSVPIKAQISGLADPGEPDPLIADRSACVVSYDYVPDTGHFTVEPVDVDASLRDPDAADFSEADMDLDFERKRRQMMRHG